MMTQSEVPVNASQSNLRILWLPAFLAILLLIGEVYLLVHDWGSLARINAAASTERIAVYVSGKKNVRQKSVGTLIWETPVPNMPLYRESEIATTDDSEAVLRFSDESELIVEPNSLLILEEAPSSMKTGNDGRIVARLVRGSVKRKNAGTNPFFVKLSASKEAPAVQIKDTKGDAVFRVIYRLQGYEVVVESGSVVVDDKDPVSAGGKITTGDAPKLNAPVLKKPKVQISPPHHSQIFWNWLRPEASAAENKISIEFSWEPTPDAREYLIQISKNQDFSEIMLEKRVTGLEYNFEMTAPEQKSELYFRVAGISGNDVTGNFSSVERVDVKPDELKAPLPEKQAPVIAEIKITKPTPAPTPKPGAAKPKPTPVPPKKEEAYVPPVFVNTGNTTWLWYGVSLDSRKFKSKSNPTETSGSGFVPSQGGFEFQHAREPGHYYSLGGIFSYESEKANLPAPSNNKFSTSSATVWITYGQLFDFWQHSQTLHFGPYFTTSKKILQNGLEFSSENIYLFGAMAAIQSDPAVFKRDGSFAWRAQLALLAVGSVGVDAQAWLRKPLPFFSKSGAFYGLKGATRQTGVETSYSGTLEIGIEL